jgi:protein-L-isoaspartate(D-aspartate) O-methyltransferase
MQFRRRTLLWQRLSGCDNFFRAGRFCGASSLLALAASFDFMDRILMNGSDNRIQDNGADFEAAREKMVSCQIRDRGVTSPRVLSAMKAVPRHLFVPVEQIGAAYADGPLPIGEGQTISQPYIVGAMTDELSLLGHERVLEVGAGSGYQAAVLSLLAREVIAVEKQHQLAASASERLMKLGYSNVRIEEGDGSAGWPPGAPYAAILVTAAAPAVPPPLIDQLAEGGRLVIPVGSVGEQKLLRIVRRGAQLSEQSLFACRFVPLLGRYGWRSALQEPNPE